MNSHMRYVGYYLEVRGRVKFSLLNNISVPWRAGHITIACKPFGWMLYMFEGASHKPPKSFKLEKLRVQDLSCDGDCLNIKFYPEEVSIHFRIQDKQKETVDVEQIHTLIQNILKADAFSIKGRFGAYPEQDVYEARRTFTELIKQDRSYELQRVIEKCNGTFHMSDMSDSSSNASEKDDETLNNIGSSQLYALDSIYQAEKEVGKTEENNKKAVKDNPYDKETSKSSDKSPIENNACKIAKSVTQGTHKRKRTHSLEVILDETLEGSILSEVKKGKGEEIFPIKHQSNTNNKEWTKHNTAILTNTKEATNDNAAMLSDRKDSAIGNELMYLQQLALYRDSRNFQSGKGKSDTKFISSKTSESSEVFRGTSAENIGSQIYKNNDKQWNKTVDKAYVKPVLTLTKSKKRHRYSCPLCDASYLFEDSCIKHIQHFAGKPHESFFMCNICCCMKKDKDQLKSHILESNHGFGSKVVVYRNDNNQICIGEIFSPNLINVKENFFRTDVIPMCQYCSQTFLSVFLCHDHTRKTHEYSGYGIGKVIEGKTISLKKHSCMKCNKFLKNHSNYELSQHFENCKIFDKDTTVSNRSILFFCPFGCMRNTQLSLIVNHISQTHIPRTMKSMFVYEINALLIEKNISFAHLVENVVEICLPE